MGLEELLNDYEAYQARKLRPMDQDYQDSLGPEEHRQFLKETTNLNPALGTLLAAGVPFYTALKALGVPLGGTGEMKTSKPSLAEIGGAWTGYGQGLMSLLK